MIEIKCVTGLVLMVKLFVIDWQKIDGNGTLVIYINYCCIINTSKLILFTGSISNIILIVNKCALFIRKFSIHSKPLNFYTYDNGYHVCIIVYPIAQLFNLQFKTNFVNGPTIKWLYPKSFYVHNTHHIKAISLFSTSSISLYKYYIIYCRKFTLILYLLYFHTFIILTINTTTISIYSTINLYRLIFYNIYYIQTTTDYTWRQNNKQL